MKSLVSLLIFLTCWSSQRAFALEINQPRGELEHLGEVYVDKGTCPFECCVYRSWTVLRPTTLYDQPNGSRAVGQLTTCDRVEALTGEVSVRPVEVEVIRDFVDDLANKFVRGDRLYLLTNLGEGYSRAWAQGTLFVVDATRFRTRERCDSHPDYCNAVILGQREMTWWVEIETNDGVVGWSRESQNFDGQDDCGMRKAECPAADSN